LKLSYGYASEIKGLGLGTPHYPSFITPDRSELRLQTLPHPYRKVQSNLQKFQKYVLCEILLGVIQTTGLVVLSAGLNGFDCGAAAGSSVTVRDFVDRHCAIGMKAL